MLIGGILMDFSENDCNVLQIPQNFWRFLKSQYEMLPSDFFAKPTEEQKELWVKYQNMVNEKENF